MYVSIKSIACAVAAFCVLASTAWAVVIPFEESFLTGTANWKNSASADPTYVPTGGSDGGGYIETTYVFSSSSTNTPVLFRGHDDFDASGDAFTGDWIAGKATKISAYVRHNLPVPTQFFVRLADPGFFPGAIAVDFTPVLPNTWTLIEFDVSPRSSQFVSFEGELYGDVLDNIGKVQFGPLEPASLANDPTVYTYALDQVFVVPEPASLALLFGATGCAVLIRRNRQGK